MKKIGFIGAGNMAGAIIEGIRKAALSVEIKAYDLNREKLLFLERKLQVRPAETMKACVEGIEYLFLAVKPQNFSEVLSKLRTIVSKNTVIVSIAAGITEDYICKELDFTAKIVLVMPNTPLQLGCGATALSRGKHTSEEEFLFVRSIFDAAGITEEIPSDRMNEVIPLNGSSPAFIYLFAKHFIHYGKSVGFTEEISLRLFAQTLIGSAEMLMNSRKSVEELIQMVSSKGGTTIAGLAALEEKGFSQAIQAACENCVKRAYELTR